MDLLRSSISSIDLRDGVRRLLRLTIETEEPTMERSIGFHEDIVAALPVRDTARAVDTIRRHTSVSRDRILKGMKETHDE